MKSIYIYLIAISWSVSFFRAQTKTIQLHSNWQFKQVGDSVWRKASVPGSLHQDLLDNRVIPDPYLSDNEKKVQWVETKDWEYTTRFECTSRDLNAQNISLDFEGLDTYARVYVNNSLVLVADNMFRRWNVDIKKELKVGKNTIHIVFKSSVNEGKKKATQLPYTLPEGERVFTRKAQYHYGWDFGPRIVTCGIWKPVKLQFSNGAKINTVNYVVRSLKTEQAKLAILIETQCYNAGNYLVKVDMNSTGSSSKSIGISTTSLHLGKGQKQDTVWFTLQHPKLWWSNGLGEPTVYELNVIILKDSKLQDRKKITIGLRTIELIRETDSSGNSFYFKLNGIPVFAKGANVIPNGVFSKRTLSDEAIVAHAKSSGMNMLRVWGGGVYGSDAFYEACDKNGILVWQDLMFACAMYPGDTAFLQNVTKEVGDNVKRLAHHPCLALWCGNNEIDEAWNNWGWQKQLRYSYQDSILIWNNYHQLFHTLLPQVCNEFMPGFPYHYSSPAIGWGHRESFMQSDSHYWGVWWGKEPLATYRYKVGRFVSEYGFQSLPDYASIKTFCTEKDLRIGSEQLKAHQKCNGGDEKIRTYLNNNYHTPDSLLQYSYISQLLQRDAMKIAIEAHRSAKPKCMGTLFWQMNDCWPGFSWSAIDYYGRPKALYYSLKSAYAPVLIAAVPDETKIHLTVVSDSSHEINGTLTCELKNFRGEVLWSKKVEIVVGKFEIKKIEISRNELPAIDSSSCYLLLELKKEKELLATNRLFFAAPKHFRLSKANISIALLPGNRLQLRGSCFMKDVYLYCDKFDLLLDDNYFDLEPGVTKTIGFKGQLDAKRLKEIKTLVLNNF